ncbi:unnamed protein product [Ilex paraguariensis]|uniref:Uncharacterized protein n=1 Tax=Ilex paraguariensis TaxID=185542 RepID=A0ABC8UY79_9AQUA
MMMKQDSTTTTATPLATVCGHCGVQERRLLHHVRHRGIFRRFCTTCVLRLHPQSFCPTCFNVYHPTPPLTSQNDAVVACFKCYSSSHSQCVGSTPLKPYVCPLCINPNVPIFTLKMAEDGNGNSSSGINENCRVIDKLGAKVLLAASKIAAGSMSKAAVTARAEAERRAKEAAFTRKRAGEALKHVAFLVSKEKLKRKELLAAAEVSGSGGNVGMLEKKYSKVEDNVNSVMVGLAENNRIGNQNNVLAALNAVELREKETVEGFRAQNVILGQNNNVEAMDVDDDKRMRVIPSSCLDKPVVLQNHGTGNESDRSGGLGNLENHNTEGVNRDNGVISVPPVGDHVQNSNGREENNVALQQ